MASRTEFLTVPDRGDPGFSDAKGEQVGLSPKGDEKGFYDEKERTAAADSHGRQKNVLHVSVEREKARVPLITQCLPDEPNIGDNAGPQQSCYPCVPANAHLPGSDVCL